MEKRSSFDDTKTHLNQSLQDIDTDKNPIISQIDMEEKLSEILSKYES